MTQLNPLQPALDALAELKADTLQRVGQQGGNLNRRMRSNIRTVSLALEQFNFILTMTGTVTQQTQIISKVVNDLSKMLAAGQDGNGNGDDQEPSESKGE